jgi:hypothetical protein
MATSGRLGAILGADAPLPEDFEVNGAGNIVVIAFGQRVVVDGERLDEALAGIPDGAGLSAFLSAAWRISERGGDEIPKSWRASEEILAHRKNRRTVA